MTILVRGSLPDSARKAIVVWGYEPEEENAKVIANNLSVAGMKAEVYKADEFPRLHWNDWVITVGGPVHNSKTRMFNSGKAIPVTFMKSDGDFWPCVLYDKKTGETYGGDKDGTVASFKYSISNGSLNVTMIAGCAREGTDIATNKFTELLKGKDFSKGLPLVYLIPILALGAGLVLLKR